MSASTDVIRFRDFTDPDHPDTQRLVGVRTVTVVGIPAPGTDPYPHIELPALARAGA